MPEFVRIEPEVIEEIVRVCDVMLDELRDSLETASRLAHTPGFGDFFSAQQLAAGYSRKGKGTPESAFERTEQFIDVLEQMKAAFASGGQAFLEAEFDWARQLHALDEH